MIKINKCLLILLAGVLLCFNYTRAHAQEEPSKRKTDSLMVFYRQGISVFDANYKQNGIRCKEFVERFEALLGSVRGSVDKVHIYASASPEGSSSFNERLANERAKSAIAHLHKDLAFADSVVVVQIITEDWDGLAARVRKDNSLNHKDAALAIITNSSDPLRKTKLQQLDGGRVWNYLLNRYFEELRTFKIYVHFSPDAQLINTRITAELPQALALQPVAALPVIRKELPAPPVAPQWHRELTLKTNMIGWAMLGANIAVEYDIIPHLSVALPFHYSGGLDYFKPTIKFRGIVLQPEVRYYPFLKDSRNDGFFVGAHFGLGWYNYALGGEFRIQDYKGRRPAYGGGIDLGYAAQFRKNPRWGMEFGIGAGVYDAKYDIFYNEFNGPYAETGVRKVYLGIDCVSLSFTYKFDLKGREGRR